MPNTSTRWFLFNDFQPALEFQPLLGFFGAEFARRASVKQRRVVFGGRLGTDSLLAPLKARNMAVVLLPAARADGLLDYQLQTHLQQIASYRDAAVVFVANLELIPARVKREYNEPHLVLRTSTLRTAYPPVVSISRNLASVLLALPIEGLAVGYSNNEVSVEFRVKESSLRLPARNVVAVWPGSDPLLVSQYIVVTASADHTSPTTNDLQPNQRAASESEHAATGMAALMAIAEHFASRGIRPKRSIVFLWTDAGEDGALGSAHFIGQALAAKERIIAHVGLASLGHRSANGRAVVLLGASASGSLARAAAEINDREELRLRLDPTAGAVSTFARGTCPGGRWSFVREGIPSVVLTTPPSVSGPQGPPDYDLAARAARLAASLVVGIANGPGVLPPPEPPDIIC
jgi:hypothetical protein